ncbi:hypothetical protein ACFFP0_04585 [Rhizobium puerariae]|uniref:DUF1127 domain-containing protein n=1 Tax=Rhizobium puerariae TaxID=1585791 RepID=A0ABV6AC27_9HYPH
MSSVIRHAAGAVASVWHRYRQRKMERSALLTIILRRNDHLRRDAGLPADSDLARPGSGKAEHALWKAGIWQRW